jgi:hypothetical protein
MAGATATKTIGPDGGYKPEDLAELAAQLGLPVTECYFEINAINAGVRTLSARARSSGDPLQDLRPRVPFDHLSDEDAPGLPLPSEQYIRTRMA